MNIPYLELALADDKIRPALGLVWIGKEETFASDAHVMVVHKTVELFGQPFIDSLPDVGISLPPRVIKDIRKDDVYEILVSEDKKSLMLLPNFLFANQRPTIIYRLNDPDCKPPAYHAVVPRMEDARPIDSIQINPRCIDNLAKALTPKKERLIGMKFYFMGKDKGILVIPQLTDESSSYGLIMPMMM